MRFSRMINVVGVHTEGELNEVITGGVLDVPGRTMFDKMRWLQTEGDDLRKFLLHEPRGKVTQCVNLVLPPTVPEADAGFVIMESDYYVPMSGSNTICTVTALLETGILPMTEPVTRITLEAPGGLVRVEAACRNGKCESVTFTNLPSFVFALDCPVEVEGLGTVMVDVAYGGMIYAMTDAGKLGFRLDPSEARDLVDTGEKIKRAAAKQVPAVHPENPEIHTINQTLWAGPLQEIGGQKTARNAVIVSPGRIDRSPCGTGTCARLAIMHARGQIKAGERFIHKSIIDTTFIGAVLSTTQLGGKPAVTCSITGRAWITAFHQYVLDPSDPLPTGYRLSDTWPNS
ncbi:MAG TPA: proline racemase family protein [Hypericibacter adhaerens]|uniref:proline racemase family protein n=1 Tax=Hypericibacter adhaerens TaxID=2602016 RepID=UPI002C830B2E|nr:proline racemase family protein [Hypericibacter adhaerens]HWA45397.1 proline racemase family protein [Hypericibacter adhaerens]